MENGRKVVKRTILSSMDEVVELAKKYSLEPEFYEKAATSLKYISKVLKLTTDEAMVLSLFFEQSSRNRIWLSSVADMIGVSNIRAMSLMSVADELVKKGLACGKDNRKDEKYYFIPGQVINCIRQNLPVTPAKMEGLTTDELFERIDEIFEEDDVQQWQLVEKLRDLVEANKHLAYCRTLISYDLYDAEFLIANVFANRLVNNDDDNIGISDWQDYLYTKSFARRILKNMKEGRSPLVVKKILEPKNNDGVRDANCYHFTAMAKEELFPDMELAGASSSIDQRLTSHKTFAQKRMFYSPRVQSQIDRLAELLQPEKFKEVTQRLSENGMRQGFAALLYGSPGTGKSETVYQLARMTGRDVLAVDVTQIKSCWVGESEQYIKSLFDRYRKYVRDMEVAPILLFNEADAVLGLRQENAARAVDKMENAIQNIILQEMESLEGIMIATTNLTTNLDKAFDRRFIYKIEFDRPTLDAKQQIWMSMIPTLTVEVAHSLAKDFDLSGGQIENIARKRAVELILTGNEPSAEQMREWCREETMDARQGRRNKVGF